jgi:hypothetical protein
MAPMVVGIRSLIPTHTTSIAVGFAVGIQTANPTTIRPRPRNQHHANRTAAIWIRLRFSPKPLSPREVCDGSQSHTEADGPKHSAAQVASRVKEYADDAIQEQRHSKDEQRIVECSRHF